ncbi:hypothetical protein M2347_003641 [Chryseobacterium sp. H1D6B]|nr:hypothetical protein [Chryseobacterium sp. H1D6B]
MLKVWNLVEKSLPSSDFHIQNLKKYTYDNIRKSETLVK